MQMGKNVGDTSSSDQESCKIVENETNAGTSKQVLPIAEVFIKSEPSCYEDESSDFTTETEDNFEQYSETEYTNIKQEITDSTTTLKPHQCSDPNCGQVFNSFQKWSLHMVTCHSWKPYICPVNGCTRSFSHPQTLKNHRAATHKEIVTVKCESALFEDESTEYSTTDFDSCDTEHEDSKTSSSRDGIFKQPRKKSPPKPYKCQHGCSNSFVSARGYRTHVFQFHGIRSSNMINKQESTENLPLIYKCHEVGCEKSFNRLWLLTAHKQKYHTVRTDNDKSDALRLQNVETSSPPTKKIKLAPSKKHLCPMPECEAAFPRLYRLNSHIVSFHGGIKPYQCPHENCDKSYTNAAHLKRHTISVHLGEDDHSQQVICGVDGCGIVCANKYSLAKHISRQHVNLPFECSICNQKFKRKTYLNAHKFEKHNEEGPYKCSVCPKNFVQFSLYRKHISRHRTFTCDCEEVFQKWTEYVNHKKTSCTLPKIQYSCTDCNKVFTLNQNLTQHRLHCHAEDEGGENAQFKCPYLDCARNYKYKKNLNFHIKTFHEKVIDYFKCTAENCEAVLKSKKNLKQHLRLCHSNVPKEKKPRKARKDKGISKRSTIGLVTELCGVKMSEAESKKTREKADKLLEKVESSSENEEPKATKLGSFIQKILHRNKKQIDDKHSAIELDDRESDSNSSKSEDNNDTNNEKGLPIVELENLQDVMVIEFSEWQDANPGEKGNKETSLAVNEGDSVIEKNVNIGEEKDNSSHIAPDWINETLVADSSNQEQNTQEDSIQEIVQT